MAHYVNYDGGQKQFSLPQGWNLISSEDKPPVPGVADPMEEIKRALDTPVGSPKIEELARPGMDVVLLFDDLQRPTPAYLALPEIMNRLNRAGPSAQVLYRQQSLWHVDTMPIGLHFQFKPFLANLRFQTDYENFWFHSS